MSTGGAGLLGRGVALRAFKARAALYIVLVVLVSSAYRVNIHNRGVARDCRLGFGPFLCDVSAAFTQNGV